MFGYIDQAADSRMVHVSRIAKGLLNASQVVCRRCRTQILPTKTPLRAMAQVFTVLLGTSPAGVGPKDSPIMTQWSAAKPFSWTVRAPTATNHSNVEGDEDPAYFLMPMAPPPSLPTLEDPMDPAPTGGLLET